MPQPHSQALTRAQVAYAKGSYTVAHELYSTLLSKEPTTLSPSARYSILDARCKTLLKLSRLPDALRDARAMIKLDRSSSSGYLRAGQVLGRQGMWEKARDVLALGVESVTDPDAVKVLEEMLEGVRKQITPVGARDWIMTVLPVEILQIVLGFVGFKQIVLLQRVCRGWRDVLRGMPRVWRELDFDVKREVRHKTVEAYVQRARGQVSKFAIRGVAPGTLRMVVHKCRNLESVILGETSASLKDPMAWLKIIMDARNLRLLCLADWQLDDLQISALFEALPHLTHFNTKCSYRMGLLSMQQMAPQIPPRIRSLVLVKADNISFATTILETALGLEQLTLAPLSGQRFDLRHLIRLRAVNLSMSAHSYGPLLLPPSIQTVRLTFDHESEPPLFLNSSISAGELPQLQRIWVTHRHASNRVVELLNQCGKRLREFAFMQAWGEPGELFLKKLKGDAFPELEILTLDETDFRDDCLAILGSHCPELQDLSLINGRHITGSGVRQLVEKAPKLKRLFIQSCQNVNFDVVKWVRNRGIKIRLDNPS